MIQGDGAPKEQPGELCTYCPDQATTRDDIQTKCLFGRPVPANLIKVPFPGGAFFPEDETHVRRLRPAEEILVVEPSARRFAKW